MIIAIANTKGGVGKTTIAVHLAAWLNDKGFRVILADCDVQRSSSEWIRQAVPEIAALKLDTPDEVLNELPKLREEADFVVADGPGSQTEMSRALLLRADFAIVPCKASMLEVRALAKATEVLRQSQDIRKGLPQAVAILSMVGQKYKLTHDMKEAADALELTLASSAVTLRQIYADAPGQGTLVWRMGKKGKEAAEEIDTAFKELLDEVIAEAGGKVLSMQKGREKRRSGQKADSPRRRQHP